MTMGKGAMISMSRKQKLNSMSSTISELVGADDATTIMLWTSFLWRSKVTRLMRIFFTKTTRVQFCWRKMVGRVQGNNHVH